MRVMHVITKLGLGGAEGVAVNLASGLAGESECLVFAVLRGDAADGTMGGHHSRVLRDSGIALIESPARTSSTAALISPFSLARAISEFRPDIVHSHTDIPDYCISIVGRWKSLRTVRTIHNTALWPTRTFLGGVVERGLHDELVVGISRAATAAYGELRDRYGLAKCPNLLTIPNGVAEPKYLAADEALSTFGGRRADVQIGMIGRFELQKGMDIALAALAELPDRHRARIHINVVGEGSLSGSLRRQATSLGLPVSFHPPVPNISRLLRAFDLILMPSRFEGMGLLAVEAQLAEVPVIVSDADGINECMPSGWPLTCEAGSVASLADTLDQFLEHGIASSLLREASVAARSRFSVPAMIEKYKAAYVALLRRPERLLTS